MKLLQIPKYILLSLYSKEFYSQVYKDWKGIGFLYILLLIALCFIPISIKLNSILSSTFTSEEDGISIEKVEGIIRQVPEMSIKKGELHIDVEQPYIIKNPKTGNPLIIIDTTGKITSIEETNAYALVTKRSLIFKEKGQKTKRISFVEIEDLLKVQEKEEVIINQGVVMLWVMQIVENSALISTVFYFWQVLAFFIFFAMRGLIFSIIGILISQMVKADLSFRSIIRISMVTSTPIVLVETATNLLGQEIFSYRELVYFVLHAMYLYWVIEAVKKSQASS